MTGIYSMMQTFIRFISLIAICLFFGSGLNQAQENNAVVVMTIIDDATIDEIFLMDFEAELADYGIELVFTEINEQFPPNTILSIQVDDTFDSIIFVSVTKTHYFTEISPLLSSNVVIISQAPTTENDTLMMGVVLYSLGEFEEAENLLLMVSEDEESLHHTSVLKLLGNIQLLREDYTSAIQYYEEIDDEGVNANLLWTYHHEDRSDEAYVVLNDDIDRYRDSSEEVRLTNLLPVRARLYALDFDYDSAIADMDEAITVAEEHNIYKRALASLYTIRGEIIFLIYEWDRVEDNFNIAIELDDTYAPAYFQRGVLFYTMARREDALADFEMYLELDLDGIYLEEAETYIDSIQTELDALNG